MPLLWFSRVCEGYPCPDIFSFFKHGLIKNLQFQGWGWFSSLRGFSWLWVLCLSNQLKGECFKASGPPSTICGFVDITLDFPPPSPGSGKNKFQFFWSPSTMGVNHNKETLCIIGYPMINRVSTLNEEACYRFRPSTEVRLGVS